MLKQARKVREAAQAALNQQFAGVMAEFEQRISEAEVKGKMSAYFSVKFIVYLSIEVDKAVNQ